MLPGWRASLGGASGMLAWVAWVVCLRGWCAGIGGVGEMLACVEWVGSVGCYNYCCGYY